MTVKRNESKILGRQAADNQVCAACVHRDRPSLIILRKLDKSKSPNLALYEYPIKDGKIAEEGRKLGRLKLAKTADDLFLSAFQSRGGGGTTFVVATPNGSIEVAWHTE